MISTDITGVVNNNSAQVFSLLAVVTNPEIYAEKLKTLMAAIEEQKKYVELIAPASEIMALRTSIVADKAAAAASIEEAKAEAKQLKATAKAQAQVIVEDAEKTAASIKKVSAEMQASATAKLAEADATATALKSQLASAAAAEKAAKAQVAAAEAEKKALEVEKIAVISIKDKLSAKVKAFAEDVAK